MAMVFLLTQMIIPAIRNEDLFPFLRKKSARQRNEEQYDEMNKRIDNLEHVKDMQGKLEERISKLEDRKNEKL
jgi:hypothetical protein